MRCGVHVLNLIVQARLKESDEFVDKIRESVKYVKIVKREKLNSLSSFHIFI